VPCGVSALVDGYLVGDASGAANVAAPQRPDGLSALRPTAKGHDMTIMVMIPPLSMCGQIAAIINQVVDG
jgi:hypothetical protein